jgi:hypothetical protein
MKNSFRVTTAHVEAADEYIAQFQYQTFLHGTRDAKLIRMNARLPDLADDRCNRGAA